MGYKIVIPVIAIVFVLFTSGLSVEVFADHENSPNANAYLFKVTGNGGAKWGTSIDQFVQDNSGVVHWSAWNDYTWTQAEKSANLYGGQEAPISPCDGVNTPGQKLPPGIYRHWTTGVNDYSVALHDPMLTANGAKLMMVGYSYGGAATAFVASDPRNNNVEFDLVSVTDPVGPNGNRVNVIRNMGYEHSPNPCDRANESLDVPCNVVNLANGPHTTRLYFDCANLENVENGDHTLRKIPSNVQSFINIWQEKGLPPADNLMRLFDIAFFASTKCKFVNPDNSCIPVSTFVSHAGKNFQQARPDACNLPAPPPIELFNLGPFIDWIKEIAGPVFTGGCHGAMPALAVPLIQHEMNQMNNAPSIGTTEFFVNEGDEIITVEGTDSPTRWDNPDKMKLTFRVAPNVDVVNPHNDIVRTEFSSVTTTPDTPADLTTPKFDDGPSDEILELQVEDNGFPCDDCTQIIIDDNNTPISNCSGEAGENWPGGPEQCIIDFRADDFAKPNSKIFNSKGALGWWDNQLITIHVQNVDPTIASTFGTFEGNNLRLFVHTTDPSMADTENGFNYTIDWGDGTVEIIHGNSIDVFNHFYQQGAYTVTVTATDKDGGISDEITLDVETPFLKLLKLINDLRDDGTLNKGNANSFTSKVNGIMGSLDKENFTPVCNVVNALINEIKQGFEKPGKLPLVISGDLIEKIQEEREPIGCNGGVIDVVKQTIPDGHTDQFTFTGDVSGTIGDGEKIRLGNLTSGTYSTTETVSSGQTLANIFCSANDYTKDLTTRTVTINLQENEYAVCVFFNTIDEEIESSFIGRGDGSASSNTAISDIRLHSSNSNPSSPQTSDDITDDKKGGGGDEHLTRPTFGISHETFETIVDSGFRFNDQSFTINDNFHTPFAQQTVNIGEVNSFEAKIYADKRLKVQEFLFGIPNVGEAHLAELGVEVWYDYNGNIEEVKAVQKSNVIDKETIVATHEKTKCQSSDIDQKCDVTNVSMIFLEPLKDKVMAVKAIDYKNRYQITYLNEGVEIAGESLNPMQTYLIPSNVRDQGLIKVTQLAKYSPYWQSEDTRTFEMNSFGSFKEINITFERFQDTGTAYTRLHSGFGGVMAYELKRATGIFDASQLISELPESFAYVFPEAGDRMTEEMKAKMLEQEQIARKIIEESKVQARW